MYYSPYMQFSRNPLINILLILSILVTMWASFRVNSKIKKFSSVFTSNYTGYELCIKMLRDNNVNDVKIIEGNFSLGGEYYNPSTKTVALSSEAYHTNSVAAVSIAAHEVGHAIQKNENYIFGQFRNILVKPVNFISQISYYIFIFGMISTFAFHQTNMISILYFSAFAIAGTLLFQIVTLPVEFNASKRALTYLRNNQVFGSHSIDDSREVLSAAALTYVAAAASTLVQLLRILSILGDRD